METETRRLVNSLKRFLVLADESWYWGISNDFFGVGTRRQTR
jgi:hypothetical protein